MSLKLGDLTTELYLAEGKKRVSLWKRVAAALTQLGASEATVEQLVNMDDPVKLAEFIQKYKL